MDGLGQLAAIGAALVVIIGGVVGAWIRYGLPRWRSMWKKIDAALESVIGREPVVDLASGRTLAPGVPGIGVRMANVEDSLALLVANQTRLDDHDHRIGRLEEAVLERIVTKVESTQAWAAVEAVANNAGEPPETIEEHHL